MYTGYAPGSIHVYRNYGMFNGEFGVTNEYEYSLTLEIYILDLHVIFSKHWILYSFRKQNSHKSDKSFILLEIWHIGYRISN